MSEILELSIVGDGGGWNPVQGGVLPDWAKAQRPDYPNEEVKPGDIKAGYNRFANLHRLANRVRAGYQVIMQISGTRANIWERLRPIN